IGPVISALDEELRPDRSNELDRRVFLEDDYQVDRSKRCEHSGAFRLALDGTARPLDARCRRVAVETDTEPIARRLRLTEHRYMTGMQQVEAPVGKADFEPMAAPTGNQVERMGARHDLIRGVQIAAAKGGDQLACIDDRCTDLADNDAG